MGRIKTTKREPKDAMHAHIGGVLLSLRRKQNVTLRETAEGTGLSLAFIAEVENGQQMPTLRSVWKLAKFFEVSVSVFLKDYDGE